MSDASSDGDDLTIRVSRRFLRRGGLVVALIAVGAVGFGLGVLVADGDDSGGTAGATGPARATRATTTTTSTSSSTTTTVAPEAVADPGSGGSAGNDGGGEAADAGAAGDGGDAPVPPAATAEVSKNLPACVPPALATSVTITWHGTGGISYFLQITSSLGGPPLFRGAVDANGSKTLQPIGCQTGIQALFTTNTVTGSVSDNA